MQPHLYCQEREMNIWELMPCPCRGTGAGWESQLKKSSRGGSYTHLLNTKNTFQRGAPVSRMPVVFVTSSSMCVWGGKHQTPEESPSVSIRRSAECLLSPISDSRLLAGKGSWTSHTYPHTYSPFSNSTNKLMSQVCRQIVAHSCLNNERLTSG